MREDCGFDEVGDRRGRQRRRRLPRQRPRSAAPADRQPLRHGAQRRQVRRPARHPGADGLRARAARARAAPALRHRGGRLRRGGRPALQGGLPRLRRADRALRPRVARRRPTPTASRCARRCERGRPAHVDDIAALARDPARYLGFVEVHIEQGPVLNELDLPLGIVTSINGSVRYVGEVDRHGEPRRHDADGPAPRRRGRRRRARAVRRAARGRRCRTSSAPSACSRCRTARSTSCPGAAGSASTCAPPPTRRATRCAADVLAELRAHLRAARRALHARGDDARGRRAERPGLAGALGARGRVARPAGVPHAERRRPRRDEAARGHAAGDAVRARHQRRHQPQPARRRSPTTTPSSPCGRSQRLLGRSCAERECDRSHEHPRHDATRRLDRRPLRRRSALPAGAGAACRPTRRPATTRRTPSARRRCSRASASHVETHPVPADEVQRAGLASITNLVVRRRYGDGGRRSRSTRTATWCRRAKAGRTIPTAAEIVDGKLYGRASAVSKSDFATYTFARARARSRCGAPLRGARRAALHLRRGVRRRARPGLAARAGPDAARLC